MAKPVAPEADIQLYFNQKITNPTKKVFFWCAHFVLFIIILVVSVEAVEKLLRSLKHELEMEIANEARNRELLQLMLLSFRS